MRHADDVNEDAFVFVRLTSRMCGNLSVFVSFVGVVERLPLIGVICLLNCVR